MHTLRAYSPHSQLLLAEKTESRVPHTVHVHSSRFAQRSGARHTRGTRPEGELLQMPPLLPHTDRHSPCVARAAWESSTSFPLQSTRIHHMERQGSTETRSMGPDTQLARRYVMAAGHQTKVWNSALQHRIRRTRSSHSPVSPVVRRPAQCAACVALTAKEPVGSCAAAGRQRSR